ncbi:MAG: hypothetical protein Q9180_009743 [Flavoplaca navasiana]
MAFPFQNILVDRNRMIHVPRNNRQHNLHVDNLRAVNKALHNHLNTLEIDKKKLRQASDRHSHQIADLKKRLEKSERDRSTTTKKNRELGAKIDRKERAYRDLDVQNNILHYENRSLHRSLQEARWQPPHRRH